MPAAIAAAATTISATLRGSARRSRTPWSAGREPARIQVVEHRQARNEQLISLRVPDAIAHHAGPSSAQIASATRRPSTAEETMPPAYPAPSPVG